MRISRMSLAFLAVLVGLAAADPVFLVPPRLLAGEAAVIVIDPSATEATACIRTKDSATCDALSATDIMGGSLAVPDIPSADYTVQIDWKTSSGDTGTVDADVSVIDDPVFLLADLDKPKYKPGETVQLRLLALKSNFGPAPGGTIEVTVTSPPPSKFKILRETLEVQDLGDANLTLPIADEALLGLYEINAVHTDVGATTTVSFEVDEFVLPKFEVTLELNEESVSAEEPARLTGKVQALYTFGEWVPGELLLTIRQDGNSWNPWIGFGGRFAPETVPAPSYSDLLALEVSLVDGTYDFGSGIPASGGLTINEYGGDLLVEAKVTDPATGTFEVAQATVKVSRNRESVRVAASKSYFKPGLPMTVVLNALDGAGKPVAEGTTYSLEVVGYQQYYGYASNDAKACPKPKGLTFHSPARCPRLAPDRDQQLQISNLESSPVSVTVDGEGRAWASVEIPQDDPSCCDPSKYLREDVTENSCCVVNVHVRVFSSSDASYPVAETCVTRASSRASRYLMVDRRDDVDEPAVVGSDVALDLRATADWTTTPGNLRYTVVSRGVIVAGGAASAVLDGDASQEGSRTVASLRIPITEAMAPLAKVLVLFNDGSDVVADAIEIPVTIAPSNQVSATFDGGEPAPSSSPAAGTPTVRPGGSARVKLGAAPGSRVFYTAIDRAVNLLGPRAEVTAAAAVGQLAGLGVEVTAVTPKAPADAEDPKFFDPVNFQCCHHVGSVIAEAGLVSAASVAKDELFYPCVPAGPYQSCFVGCYPTSRDGAAAGGEVEFDDGFPMADMEEALAGGQAPTSDRSAGDSPETPRRFFPETWLWNWQDLPAGETEGGEDVVAPDTITTWELSAFAVSPTEGLGVATPGPGLRVFKPFFVDVKLPFHATRYEELEVLVTVFNYDELLDETTSQPRAELTATVTLDAASGSEGKFKITPTEAATLTVPRGGFATTTFVVNATGLGSIKLAAGATASAGGYSDFLEKPVLVRAEGVRVEKTVNHVIQLSTDGATESHSIDVELPAGYVAGSEWAQLTVVGDIMGPTLTGLERLLSVPTGCGEQNMITLAPNVYVARYLAEVRRRALSNMVRGYQRELTYRHGSGANEGGFSAFGESDSSASMWLTAFVVKVFGQSSEFITVDDDVMRTAGAWMVAQQEESGAFPAAGQVIHTEMVGGVSGPLTMTAYVLGALADAPAAVTAPGPLVLAARYLGDNLDTAPKAEPTAQDVYVAALAAYGLSRLQANAAALGVVDAADVAAVAAAHGKAEALLAGYKESGEGNVEWWGHEGAAVAATRALRRRRTLLDEAEPAFDVGFGFWEEPKPQPTTIESTAYGLLTSLANGEAGAAYPVAKWLLAQRTASGGFVSTQDTVVGLQALAEYSAAAYSSAGGVGVTYTNGAADAGAPLTVTSGNFDVLQVRPLSYEEAAPPALPRLKVDFTATANGAQGGTALVSTTMRFNQLAPEAQSMFDFTVEWGAVIGDPNRKKIEACVLQGANLRAIAPDEAECDSKEGCGYEVEMAVMKLAMFTGFEPDTSSLDDVKGQKAAVQRWDYDGEAVSLYLLGVPASSPLCIEFQAVKSHTVRGYQQVLNEVYAYYEPEVHGTAYVGAARAGLAGDDAGGGGSPVTEPPVASPSPTVPDATEAPTSSPSPSPPPPPPLTPGTSAAPALLRSAAAAMAAAVGLGMVLVL